MIRPHLGSLNSWLFPGSTWKRGKVAVWFPVRPSGQVASGARCPSALWGLLCFLPVVCVSISPSGAEMRRVSVRQRRWAWPSGSFPGKVEAELCLRGRGCRNALGTCSACGWWARSRAVSLESWAMHPGSRPLRGRGVPLFGTTGSGEFDSTSCCFQGLRGLPSAHHGRALAFCQELARAEVGGERSLLGRRAGGTTRPKGNRHYEPLGPH